MTVRKILTEALVSTWSLVSSGKEHVKRKMHPCRSGWLLETLTELTNLSINSHFYFLKGCKNWLLEHFNKLKGMKIKFSWKNIAHNLVAKCTTNVRYVCIRHERWRYFHICQLLPTCNAYIFVFKYISHSYIYSLFIYIHIYLFSVHTSWNPKTI